MKYFNFRSLKIALNFMTIGLLVFSFQNCSEAEFSQVESPSSTATTTDTDGGKNDNTGSDPGDETTDPGEDPPQGVAKSITEIVPNETSEPINTLDLLVIVDNSQSMQPEQEKLAQGFRNLTQALDGIDYRIAVTSSDPGNDGALLPYSGGEHFVIRETPNREVKIRERVVLGSGGSTTEKFIAIANSALDRNEKGWIRPSSHFGVLAITDEDECGYKTAECLRSQSTIDSWPETFLNNQPERSKSFNPVAVIPGDQACLLEQREAFTAYYAQALWDVAQLTGGTMGSLCENEYSQHLSFVGEELRNRSLFSVTLDCQNIGDYTVTLIPEPNTSVGSSLRGNEVVFDQPLEGGTQVKIDYICLD